jgi:glyoxylase-like metal-dependent hydrolase (beta-lactamase superfamily II)
MTRQATYTFLTSVLGMTLSVAVTRGELTVEKIEIAPSEGASRVPEVAAQGRMLAPQAVSAVNVSADGKIITVGTMAFSHDANVWQFGADGAVLARRNFPPWAPMQVATLSGGRVLVVGLAYSRVTPPDPTVWFGPVDALFGPTLADEFVEADSRDGELARLRPGEGDWRTGWLASQLGELFVHGPDWAFKPPGLMIDGDGRRVRLRYEDKNQLPTSRAMRMAASADGKRAAFGWLTFSKPQAGFPVHKDALSVWEVNPNRPLWSAPPADFRQPALPDPIKDFPELVKDFRLAADALVPGTVAAAVALNADGSRVAIVEYGVWSHVRSGPAIGKWDPPIHVLNFVPRQRGRLRVFDGSGHELRNDFLPEAGMFEVGFGEDRDAIWCRPASWFARGMAGEAWLPTDPAARTVYRVSVSDGTARGLVFPDAVADCAIDPRETGALVSCWNGITHLVTAGGKVAARLEVRAPARLEWIADGSFAVAGTADGRLLRIERDGKVAWNQAIPVAELPAIDTPPAPVVPDLPIFQGGRIPNSEHAYVGDIWIIRAGREAVFVDAAGTSGFATTQARLRALGIERVTHVLQTHTHGDHCGGAYLWRAAGAKIVGPKSAAIAQTWLMPMLTDYGIFPPRPLDVPLPLTRVGDEVEFEAAGIPFGAVFVPGHSFDLTLYKVELGGRRILFTGDLGFQAPSDILHRCWGDAAKARAVVKVIREKVLSWKPEIVFTGHGVRPQGMEFMMDLVVRTEESLKKAESQ